MAAAIGRVETEITTNEKVKKDKSKEWISAIVKGLIIYLLVTSSIGITRVSGHSMDPTLRNGSFLIINKLSALFMEPSYGDVVIVHQNGYDIVKRVIGIPGDKILIQEGQVYVNDVPIPEIYTLGNPDDMELVTVQAGKVFIMGDNRTPGESLDSRDSSMGPISSSDIKGYAVVSLFPFYKIMKPLHM
ncbi:signal peptidase I [Peribacillus alkalitolerans]|uniref:signal peptidase I n=1 Tax=Peribacillus alkalitolerans TaxID=1550385 RepID=UPI0013D1A5AF|nr:signal peptidase I [Peribacillus alkalitolerans]